MSKTYLSLFRVIQDDIHFWDSTSLNYNLKINTRQINDMEHLYTQVRDQLDPELVEKMKKNGESFFDGLDLDGPELTDMNVPPIPTRSAPIGTVDMIENKEDHDNAFLQLEAMIESGMHPSYLTNKEKDFMEHRLGKEWYKRFGFLEMDLNRINL